MGNYRMKRTNSVLVTILLVTYFGNVLAWCDCEDTGSDTSCSNIHACYNCATVMDSDCLQTYTGVDEATCRTYLTTTSSTRASYVQATGECQLTWTSCGSWYSKSIDVLFRKTCDTGCSNYTLTKLDDQAVTSGSVPYTQEYTFTLYGCFTKCQMPPSQDCTVSYDPDSNKCYVYATNCGGSCLTEPSPGWIVYTFTCNGVACPALSDPLNGAVDTSAGTMSGDQAIYSCNTGYTLSGTSAITCGSDGNWNNSAPTCTPVDCGSLSNITYGTVSYTLTTYGSQSTYNCSTGYTINGSTVTTCGSDGKWDNLAPTCTPVDCGPLSNIIDGTVSYTLTTYGSQATYNCSTGYTINGSTVMTCGSDGKWDNLAPTCTPVDCGSLSNIIDGTVSYTLTTYGSQATYNCSTGYTINGSTVMTCGSDGKWDNLAPTCTPVDCGSLSNIIDGTVSYTLTTYGSQATYNCSTGYTINGSTVTTCGSDGKWDNLAPTCTPADCGLPSNITDGTVSYRLTTYSSQATYKCSTGFTINGSIATTCGSDGNWDNLAPTCTPVDCGPLPKITDGTVSYRLTTYGAQATYKCSTGFTINGSTATTCGSDGNWENSAPTCTPVDCGSLSNITNGTVSYTLTTYGSRAIYMCNTGYTIKGSSVRTCGSDGNWDNSTPTCTPVDCGSLFNITDGTVSYNSSTYGSQATYICNTGYTLSGSAVRTCGVDENWDNSAPTCTVVDCGSPTEPAFGFVSYAQSTYGALANYTCNIGYVLTGSNSRICLLNGTWNSVEPECVPAGVTSTPAPPARILYIMPCICYPNNTFVNMSQEEIVQQLIAGTKIDTKSTTLAQHKLKSRSDPRMSSTMIGVAAITILCVIGGLILFCDILSVLNSLRSSDDRDAAQG